MNENDFQSRLPFALRPTRLKSGCVGFCSRFVLNRGVAQCRTPRTAEFYLAPAQQSHWDTKSSSATTPTYQSIPSWNASQAYFPL